MDKKRIHEMLETMTSWSLSEMQSKGKENVDTEELGKAIDMVKDLAEAEMSVYKACYYKTIIEAMEKSENEDELMLKMMIEEHGEAEGRAGYDRWRNSKGRFAPKGTGHETSMAMARGRMGYDPDAVHDIQQYPWYVDPNPPMAIAGYNGDSTGSNGGRSSSNTSQRGNATGHMGFTPMHDGSTDHTGKGTRYSMYDDAKRSYHESGSMEHKQEMTERGKQYVEEAMMSMRDIFQEADPQMQQKMKNDLANLYREFGGK